MSKRDDGQIYVVTTNIKPPFVMYDEKKDKWSGLIVDYMDTIAKRLRIKYEFQEAEDQNYGYEDQDGTWDGMIGELIDGSADIAFGGLTYSLERSKVVDFTEPFYDSVGFAVLMKRDPVITNKWGWLNSLEVHIWMCIIAAYMATSTLVWIFDTWSPYSFRNSQEKYKDEDDSAKRFFTLKEALWFSFTALTPQGGGEAPKSISARLASATWWLFGFIIIASYTANMAANLALITLEFRIDDYSDLIKQLRVQYGPVQDSAAFHYYKRMSEIEKMYYDVWKGITLNKSLTEWEKTRLAIWEYPVREDFTKLFQHMSEDELPLTLEDGVKRVKTGKDDVDFALIAEYPDVLYNAMIDCSLRMLPDIISKRRYAIAVPKGSDLKRRINNVLYNLSNTNYLQQLKKKWWEKNPNKKLCHHIDTLSPGLLIENISGLFIFIGFGVIAAGLTLIWEYIYCIYLKQKFVALFKRLDNEHQIMKKLDKWGVTKLKRPCKLADSVVRPITPQDDSQLPEKEEIF